MEDIDESRQILDRHNWDLLAAINSHMGFDVGSQQSPPPPQVDSNHVFPSSHHNSFGPNPPTSRDGNRPSSSRAVTRSNGAGGGGGLFSWILQLFTRPVEFFFRYVWEFIGFGLRFLRADPRMGMY